jgi:hypothetical protein
VAHAPGNPLVILGDTVDVDVTVVRAHSQVLAVRGILHLLNCSVPVDEESFGVESCGSTQSV